MSLWIYKNKKRFWISLIIFLLILITCVSVISFLYITYPWRVPNPVLSNELVPYSSQTANLTMLYPKNLFPGDTPQGNHGDHDSRFVISGYSFSPYIEVASRTVGRPTMEDIIQWGEDRARTHYDDFTEVNIKDYVSNGTNGKSYSGTLREYYQLGGPYWDKKRYHCYDWYVLHNQDEFVFLFCIDEKNWQMGSEVFLKMIDSIQFK